MKKEHEYTLPPGAALASLLESTKIADRLQREELSRILLKNCDTAYGQRFAFDTIGSVEEYQDRVPFSHHSDYQPYVEKLMAGQTRQLTAAEPVYYAITSGSTGVPKYVPVTEEDMMVHLHGIHSVVRDTLRVYYPQATEDDLFGKIFYVGEFAKTRLPSGQMCGIRSGSLYQWLEEIGGFDTTPYCVPKEVLFPTDLEDLTYVKLRFALAQPDIRLIHSVFLHRVVSLMDYLRENWELILSDIARGDVDERIPLAPHWKEKVRQWLPPDPHRAQQLREMALDQHPEDMIRRLWPNVRCIIGVGGRNFPVYNQAMACYGPSVPIHHFIYGASEGFLSVALEVGVPDAYLLLPQAGFFEFLPVSAQPGQRPLTMEQLEVGKQYELIFTNHSGLYRYLMQDVLEVVDFRGKAPVIRFCYRINQVLNIADEKLNTEQLQESLRLFRQETGLAHAPFCAQEDFSVRPGRYLIYVEAPPFPQAGAILDQCICQSSLGYQGCRSMGEIAPVQVRFLPPGTFQRYEETLSKQGRTLSQYKPIQLLENEETRQFFAAAATGYEEETT